jgi:signal transduction histidine kinase
MVTNPDAASLRKLLIAFAAVAAAFVGTTVYTESRALRIDAEAQSIAANALPSIEHLVAVTAALRRIEAAADDCSEAVGPPQIALRNDIHRARQDIDAELTAYDALPDYAGERALFEAVLRELGALDQALARLFLALDAGAVSEAEALADHDVTGAASRASDAIRQVITLNSVGADASAARIMAIRGQALQSAVVLDALSLALATVAAFLAWRAVRNYLNLLQAHSDLVERRADELEQFAQRVAHDLLSPLSALSFCLGAIRRAHGSDPDVRDPLDRANACVKRAQRMTDGIFAFARAGARPDAAASSDLGTVLRDVLEEAGAQSERERPEIVVEPFSPSTVACSAGVLTSVLGNLLQNAVKYLADCVVKRITVRVSDQDTSVHVEVEDTGPGLAPGLEAKLFQPYARAEGLTQPGLGLGLATVKRLCDAHGGAVGVRSVPGGGCAFWFELPKPRPASTDVPPSPAHRVRRVS